MKLHIGLVANLVCCWSLGTAEAGASEAAVIAIFDIQDKTGRFSESQVDQLTTYLSTTLGSGQRYKVVPRAQIREALNAQKSGSYATCFDEECQIEIGRELAAQLSLQTEIIAVGSLCAVAATLYDLREAASVRSSTAKSACDPDAIVVSLEKVAGELGTSQPTPAAQAEKPASETAPSSSASPVSLETKPSGPSHRIFTREEESAYTVVLETQDGDLRCAEPVTMARPCLLPVFGSGTARLNVSGEAEFIEGLELGPEPTDIEIDTGLSTGGVISLVGAGAGALAGGIGFLVSVADDKEAFCFSGSDCSATGPLVIGGLVTTGVGLISFLIFEAMSPRVTVEPR